MAAAEGCRRILCSHGLTLLYSVSPIVVVVHTVSVHFDLGPHKGIGPAIRADSGPQSKDSKNMAKDSEIPRPVPLPRPKRDRKAPTRKKSGVSPEGLRDGRLVMRVQQSLNDLLDIRAKEKGESRSRYIERLLVAFLQADPRNPVLDPWGRILSDGPAISKAADPVKFGAAWARFVALNDSLFDFRPPDRWLEEPPGFINEQRGGHILEEDMPDDEG
ncbi:MULTISPECIES: hypothetical protein [Bradyrhizobium]|uniref:hypothetical protein n=1 Tax=Bradyrhizobium TaxID=374 RepID=UPI001EDC3971|nr:hypothetical protein [Bradyrhizobium zhengyangense]MCG2645197.1 hypothetical protein [Bradyrhizobium zhengyangense]